MMTSQEILELIDNRLDSLVNERQPYRLYEPIEYVPSLDGERVKPTLMLLAYNLCREYPEGILVPACGIETYHNYALLHNDLMDQADLRRDHKTVHKRWDANTTILSGDSMLALVYQRMAQYRPDKLKEIIDPFAQTVLETGGRQ